VLARGVVQVPQQHGLFPGLTVRENVLMGGYVLRRDRALVRRRLRDVEELLPLVRDRATDKAGNLSGGQRRLVEFARSLMLDPKLVLLDEPSLGLDYNSQLAFQRKVRELAGAGTAIVLASNQVGEVESLCDRVIFLHRGRTVAEGTPEELVSSLAGIRRIVATLRNPVEYGAVREVSGVERVVPEGRDLVVHCEDRRGIVAEVVGAIVRTGGDVADLSVRRPNLEDVFVKLTGEALRDEA
jgi:ABC-type multidrug transport system ATPase subunit